MSILSVNQHFYTAVRHSGIAMSTLAQRIRSRRRELHLTQQQVARYAGITQSTLSMIESGTTASPEAGTLQRIAKVLRTSADFLMTGRDQPAAMSSIQERAVAILAELPKDRQEIAVSLLESLKAH